MSLLEQDTTKMGQVDKKTVKQLEFETSGNNMEYEVKGICDSAVYARELEAGHLLGLYYLVLWKNYPEDESTWETAAAVQHLQNLVSTCYKDHSNKPTATSPPIDVASPMAKYNALPNVKGKRKRGWLIGSMRKKVKH